MTKINAKELVEKFKKIEDELIEILKVKPLEFSQDEKKQVVKTEIKKYIKKVEKARALFDEYESLAVEIEKLTSKKDEEMLKNIEELASSREEMVSDEYEDIQVVVEDKIVSVKKKKNKPSTKEF